MRKLLILFLYTATHLVVGCSAENVPFVHRLEIRQGNIVTQDMVARLEPGMSKQQVSHVMGTPLVVDPFRPDEWVYVYRLKNEDENVQRTVRLTFQEDRLARVSGDVQPASGDASDPGTRPSAGVTVPLEEPEEPGWWERLKRAVGLGSEG
jgi:outer membrane protein assembly factor BamE